MLNIQLQYLQFYLQKYFYNLKSKLVNLINLDKPNYKSKLVNLINLDKPNPKYLAPISPILFYYIIIKYKI